MSSANQSKIKSANAKGNGKYSLAAILKEDHTNELYDIKIYKSYQINPSKILFATVGSSRCSIYEYETATSKVRLVNSFMDVDLEEVYYTCAWTRDPIKKVPFLVFGGFKGIIRSISNNAALSYSFIGHGSSINDLRFHPEKNFILLSASKDNSMRLWNTNTSVCIAIFGGVEGHRDEVLSSDFNLNGTMLISCSIDHSLRMWNLKNTKIIEAIAMSETYTNKLRSFPTVLCNFPDFITRDVHTNYIDCARWLGDLVISKSCENSVIIWKPGLLYEDLEAINKSNKNVSIIQKLDVKECDIWYMRFGIDFTQKVVALGTKTGKIYVWELSELNDIKKTVLVNNKSKSAIRAVDLSFNGKNLFCVNAEGNVFIWKRI